MTCEELRCYCATSIGDDLRSPEMAEHLRRCAECGCFVETQRELGRYLRFVRDSAPPVSPLLDSAVLCSYRSQVAPPAAFAGSPQRRKRASRVLFLLGSGAAAAAMLVAGILLFTGRRVTQMPRIKSAQGVIAPQPTLPANTAARVQAATHQTMRNSLRPPKLSGTAAAAADSSLPDGFRSLMYCDEISCGGTMEIIRMRLPASGADDAPPSTETNGTVLADVLVGADGIARGIRIVQ